MDQKNLSQQASCWQWFYHEKYVAIGNLALPKCHPSPKEGLAHRHKIC